MRQFKTDFKDVPTIMKTMGYKQQLLHLIQLKKENKKVEISGYAPKSDDTTKDVKNILIKKFGNRCVFCEADMSIVGHYDTEHYRPKSIYPWLAYEWSNFLLACHKCNRDCKGEAFPLQESSLAATMPFNNVNENNIDDFINQCSINNVEKEEKRLLLHPVLDKTEKYFDFKKDGRVVVNATCTDEEKKMAQESIKIYGLDDWGDDKKVGKRQDLITARAEIIRGIQGEVKHAVNFGTKERLKVDLKKIIVGILREIKENRPFISVRKTCITKFKTFFIDDFKSPLLEEIYNEIKAEMVKR